jgi:enamine deaminase RidA (YjgF/YER057c/UK114 family)
MSEFQRSILKPHGVAPPTGKYSHAVRVRGGELLFIAGQVSVDVDGNLVGEGDVAAQTRQVFKNIGVVLETAGGTFSDVVEFTYYLVGRGSVQPFLEVRIEIFDELFPEEKFPPATLLVVEGLVREEWLVEISTLAVLPSEIRLQSEDVVWWENMVLRCPQSLPVVF